MAILRPKYTRLWIEDCHGERCQLRPLALTKRRDFVEYQELIAELQQQNPDLSIAELYDADADFSHAVDECLRLYGLSPDRISLSQCVQLFFTYDGGQGLCWLLEFAPTQKKGKLLDPDADPYAAAIAAFWSFLPDRTLKEVIEAIDALPWTEVEAILQARNDQIQEAHPELRERLTEEDREEFIADLKSGFGGVGGFAEGPPVGSMLGQVIG